MRTASEMSDKAVCYYMKFMFAVKGTHETRSIGGNVNNNDDNNNHSRNSSKMQKSHREESSIS